jgi:UDP:flavonoid glycosyltransferase YjiC (YdhE family)
VKILFCVMDSPGIALQMAGLASELRALGHETACVANRSTVALCERHGLSCLVADCDHLSFALRRWAAEAATLLQLRHLSQAVEEMEPDVIVATPFGYGPALAAEQLGVPLAVIGGLVHVWRAGSERRAEGRHWYAAGRAEAGMAPHPDPDHAAWLGDRFLIQSAPALSGCRDGEDHATHVGDCTWDPEAADDPALEQWLAARGERPLAYVQCGREFGLAPIYDAFAAAAEVLDIALAIDTGRNDRPTAFANKLVFARPFIPRARILERADLAIGSGHPATVLGALRHGLPMVLLPHGSGTEETAAACAEAGVAVTIPFAELTPLALIDAIVDGLAEAPGLAAKRVQRQLSTLGGRPRAARLIAELANVRGSSRRDTRDSA